VKAFSARIRQAPQDPESSRLVDRLWFCRTSMVQPRKKSTNRMATKVWFAAPAHTTSKGSQPRQILVRLGHRSATSNSAIKGQWTIGDISAFGFTLSLVLLGTILSAYTDRPVFWLLVGPGPIAIGFTLITFFRQGFGRRHGLSAVEKRGRSGGHSNRVVRHSGRLCGENRCTITVPGF
jgi:hypothetical protein